MENTIKVLQHKESKLSACRQSYKEHEALVYHQVGMGDIGQGDRLRLETQVAQTAAQQH